MRFLILVNAAQDLESGAIPEAKLTRTMASSRAERTSAGTRLDAFGLQPCSRSWCIKPSGEQRSFVDGPFAETKELIAGYQIPDTNHHAHPSRRATAPACRA